LADSDINPVEITMRFILQRHHAPVWIESDLVGLVEDFNHDANP